jgi:hypothetical protein
MKTNTVHLIAAALLVPFLAPLGFVYWSGFAFVPALEISGVSATAFGTIWLAAGVHVSQRELKELTSESRKKAIANIKGAIATASRHVFFGVVYTLCGAAALVLAILSQHFHWLQQ